MIDDLVLRVVEDGDGGGPMYKDYCVGKRDNEHKSLLFVFGTL